MKRVITYGTFDLLHYGHINLLRRAKEQGDYLIVVLSTDEFNWNEKQKKCYFSYEKRKQLLEAIRYVDEVVPSPWLLDNDYLISHNIDLLVHGDDNSNHVPQEKMVIFPRTEGISSSDLRERVLDTLTSLNLNGKGPSEKIALMLIETIKKEFKLD